MSLVQILPLHLAQVGWGSLSNEDRNAPNFRLPAPGQICNSLDITKRIRIRKKILKQKVEETSIHHQRKQSSRRRRAGRHGERGLNSTVVEQRMTVEPWSWGGGGGGVVVAVSHPFQLNTGLVVNSFVITSPTSAGERMLLIPKVSRLFCRNK